MFLIHDSAWTFDTSAGAGAGLGVVVASGGMVRLKDPGGTPISFYFGGIGAAISTPSLRIPKIPKIKFPGWKAPSAAAAGSTPDFKSYGVVYRKSMFGTKELVADDFRGACIYCEGGAGLIGGISVDIMFFGASTAIAAAVAGATAGLGVGAALVASSNGILAWGGVNIGPQAGAGIGGLIGGMR
ncbi:hypothetical protein [Sphingomonas sp.]|uniref:hypothetical protein n=1 Tax=Sphingomonas sp. TaxID=28214 RepID=UPI003CC6DA88